jgi:glycerophosphoryl diester phosphodiesterase
MSDRSIFQTLARGCILNIAHRGARSLAPENTLEAARKAFAVGAHMWELDVCATRDGELLVLHDETLERTSNAAEILPHRCPWRVCDFSLDEIRRLDFGSWFVRTDPFGQIASGAVSQADCRRYVGLQAPTLEEALTLTRNADRWVNIEIKDQRATPHHATIVEKVVSLVHKLGMADRVIVSSFHLPYLERTRALSPSMVCGILTNRKIRGVRKTLPQLAPAIYHPKATAIDAGQIRSLRDDGFHVLIWVVNDRQTMIRLLESGASGLFTDFPQVLSEVLLQPERP